MSAHKNIDKICVLITAFTLVISVIFCCFAALGGTVTVRAIGYENRIFDRKKVHAIDIVMNDWDSFISNCENEEYVQCHLVIDGEAVKNVGIRAKGNTSLSSVKNSGSSRYSFKIEFDQYDSTKSYHGLDKLCLNNIIQDNTYMKDYLAYTLMYDFGVNAPLCSYAYITVNGEDWGLYLAVEAIEESFLERNYGSNYGDLYKPDSMSFGGGRGNGRDFNMNDFINESSDENENSENSNSNGFSKPSGFDMENMPDNIDFSNFDPSTMFGGGKMPDFNGEMSSDISDFGGDGKKIDIGGFGGGFGMGSDDVKLKYIDDDTDSYSNIFNNAKTTVNTADKNRLIQSLKQLSEQDNIESVVNTEEVIKYFAVHDFLCNGDSYTGQMIHNYYLYEENGQLFMIPWDYNLAYGSFSGGDGSSSVNSPIDTPVSNDMSDRPMIAWIFDSEEYTEQYHEMLKEFLNKYDLGSIITETAALIDKYVEKDPTKFCTYEEYQKGVTAIKTFCQLRSESVKGQLDGTIPSTSDGQKADSSALIDTSSLNISDMGTMGGGKGGFGGNNFGRSDKNKKADSSTETVSKTTAIQPTQSIEMPENFDPEQMPSGQLPEEFNDKRPGNFSRGNRQKESSTENETGENSDSKTDTKTTDKTRESVSTNRPSPNNNFPAMSGSAKTSSMTFYILLGISALTLLLGIIVAKLYKR